MNTTNALYRLDATTPMYEVFMGKIIGMMATLGMMVFVPGFVKIFFLIGALSLGVPLVREFTRKQLQGLLLTEDFLEITTGSKRKTERIALHEIKRVEIVEKHDKKFKKKFQGQKGETTVILIDEKSIGESYHPETKCVITTTNGKKHEIRSGYFEDGEFSIFLGHLQEAYRNQQAIGSGRPVMPKAVSPAGEDKISQVVRTNFSYLQEDLQLKKALETNMVEAYKSVYRVRDAFDISKMVNVKVIYEFRNPDNSSSFILEDDYLPELDEESIEIGKNLIDAAQKNLSLVETRIAYYKKIDRELEKMRFQEANRKKLQGVAQNLKNLQEKNTNRSIDQSIGTTNLDADGKIIHQLEELTQKVHNMEDLENSILLKEHISLFKDQTG